MFSQEDKMVCETVEVYSHTIQDLFIISDHNANDRRSYKLKYAQQVISENIVFWTECTNNLCIVKGEFKKWYQLLRDSHTENDKQQVEENNLIFDYLCSMNLEFKDDFKYDSYCFYFKSVRFLDLLF